MHAELCFLFLISSTILTSPSELFKKKILEASVKGKKHRNRRPGSPGTRIGVIVNWFCHASIIKLNSTQELSQYKNDSMSSTIVHRKPSAPLQPTLSLHILSQCLPHPPSPAPRASLALHRVVRKRLALPAPNLNVRLRPSFLPTNAASLSPPNTM